MIMHVGEKRTEDEIGELINSGRFQALDQIYQNYIIDFEYCPPPPAEYGDLNEMVSWIWNYLGKGELCLAALEEIRVLKAQAVLPMAVIGKRWRVNENQDEFIGELSLLESQIERLAATQSSAH